MSMQQAAGDSVNKSERKVQVLAAVQERRDTGAPQPHRIAPPSTPMPTAQQLRLRTKSVSEERFWEPAPRAAPRSRLIVPVVWALLSLSARPPSYARPRLLLCLLSRVCSALSPSTRPIYAARAPCMPYLICLLPLCPLQRFLHSAAGVLFM